MTPTNDGDATTAVDRYFATNADIFDDQLTEENTVPRRPRQ